VEERIDIYDEDGRPTGRTMARKGSFLHEGEYMLYVLAIIEDASGRYPHHAACARQALGGRLVGGHPAAA
jgi:hypothetical protein